MVQDIRRSATMVAAVAATVCSTGLAGASSGFPARGRWQHLSEPGRPTMVSVGCRELEA
jgi:hypothetical protein